MTGEQRIRGYVDDVVMWCFSEEDRQREKEESRDRLGWVVDAERKGEVVSTALDGTLLRIQFLTIHGNYRMIWREASRVRFLKSKAEPVTSDVAVRDVDTRVNEAVAALRNKMGNADSLIDLLRLLAQTYQSPRGNQP